MTDIKRLRCKAKSKRTGERCGRLASPGSEVCHYHGAGGGAPRGNKNAMVHGAYVNELLNDGERAIFERTFQDLRKDFQLNDSSDRICAEVACLSYIKFLRSVGSDNDSAMHRANLVLRGQLQDLKATRDKREAEANGLKTTPAEWAANLIKEVEEVRAARKEKKQEQEENKKA